MPPLQPTFAKSYLNLNELNASSENLVQSPDGSKSVHIGIVYKQPLYRRLLPLMNILVFYTALAILVYSIMVFPTDIQCGKQLSTYSPALDSIEYVDIRFNGTLTAPSVYRGDPAPAIDNAWYDFSRNLLPIRISQSAVLRSGKPYRSSTVRFREEDGGGYRASIEYTHQLHCLNALRKVYYRDYYEHHADTHFFEAKPETIRTHIDHCIEILRQVFMCNADTGLITYEWVTGFKEPLPNFNTMHRCRNLEKMQSWNHAHGVRARASRFADTVDLPKAP